MDLIARYFGYVVDSEAGEFERLVKPTRLLLLDERHAGNPIQELPQAVQVGLFSLQANASVLLS